MSKFKDVTGKKIGRLTVLYRLNNKTVYSRISRNWSIERALELKGAL